WLDPRTHAARADPASGRSGLLRSKEARTWLLGQDGVMVGRWWEWLNAEALRRDRIIAAAWFALGLVVLAAGGFRLWSDLALAQAGRGVFAVLLACAAVLATLRSRRPFLALALGLVVAAVDLSLGGSLGVVLVLTDLAYAALRYGSDRGVWITLRAGLAA